jgi:hypothetical protein
MIYSINNYYIEILTNLFHISDDFLKLFLLLYRLTVNEQNTERSKGGLI